MNSPVWTVTSVATTVLGSAAVLSLALGAFFSGARRLGALLLILGVPAVISSSLASTTR